MYRQRKTRERQDLLPDTIQSSDTEGRNEGTFFPASVPAIHAQLKRIWNRCDDLKTSVVDVGHRQVLITWLHHIVDKERMDIGILTPISQIQIFHRPHVSIESVLSASPISKLTSIGQINRAISDGFVVIFEEGAGYALSVDLGDMPGMPIQISKNEAVIEGPQEALTESLEMNMAMLRTRLRNPRLKIETSTVGVVTGTSVGVFYIDGIVRPELLDEVRQRIKRVNIDGLLDAYVLRELISDEPLSPFETLESTERPDKVIAALLQGRVAIMSQGATHALLAPTLFVHFMNSAEDMYSNYYLATAIRVLRHIMFWIAILLPSLYVSLLTYHQDLVPTPLLMSLVGQHSGIPFPTIIEAFFMQFMFEAIREAGQRLPRAIGQSVSIVGALVIGNAAVKAGLVSSGMVIVVAPTGVASFTIAGYGLVNTARVLQFVFLMAGGFIGLYGIVLAGITLVVHLVTMRSFGVPYMSPFAPLSLKDMKDAILRAPWWRIKTRPPRFSRNLVRNRTPMPGPDADNHR